MNQEAVIEERKEKIISVLKKPSVWVLGLLIVAIILGVYIRSMPMQDHNPNQPGLQPGLWDITKNDWTLGPDLDPWFFTRYAKTIVEKGSLPKIDEMRNVPLGFETSKETRVLPYMIAGTYYLVNLFGDYSVEFAAVIFPVIMFALTLVVFFLFVREIFMAKNSESKIKANIISLISTFFMVVIPIFLSRTIAGIPEKESASFFFMFIAFYLFLKAWRSEKLKSASIYGVLAGVSTALMGLIWGGVVYVFITIAIASFGGFVLNKVHKKEFVVYSSWIISSLLLMVLLSGRFELRGLLTSLDTGIAFFVFVVFAFHFLLWNTKLKKINFLQKTNLPRNIISLIIAIIFGIIVVSILLGPNFIIEKIKAINQMMFQPVTGRWETTVAENRQPYFTEWGSSFGPFIKNIPVLFWLFFIGSVILFRKMLSTIKNKDAWILTGLYVLFFLGLVFSRYAPHPHIFDGENFISGFFYYGSALLLVGSLFYYYIRYDKEGNKGFQQIDYNLLFLFSLLALTLFTARSAVRLIMVLAPVAVIFLGYLVVFSIYKFRKTKDSNWKIIVGVLMILVLFLSIFAFWSFYKEVRGQAYSFVPSYYNQQWQKAMSWVRENTDKKTTVFAHWWDYGYWVQSIGERATVLDGGNAIKYWNYLMGRLVLTGDNEKDALDFLYTHKATHLLIDSTDLGKYGAFSQIGSDENLDRLSSGPATFLSDSKQVMETANGTIRTYNSPRGNGQIGLFPLYEDIKYKDNETEIFLPSGRAGIGGVITELQQNNVSVEFKQPKAVFFYNNKQFIIPLRYLALNGDFIDYGSGLEATVYVIQRVYQANEGLQVDNQGALIYISPRLMRGLLSQEYLLNDPLGKFPNINLVHTEQNMIIASLNSQGANLGDFIYFNGLQGPIKIWEINYTGSEETKQEYLDKDYSKYISWKL